MYNILYIYLTVNINNTMTNHQTIIITLHLNSVSIILKLYLEEYKSNSTIRKITYIYI